MGVVPAGVHRLAGFRSKPLGDRQVSFPIGFVDKQPVDVDSEADRRPFAPVENGDDARVAAVHPIEQVGIDAALAGALFPVGEALVRRNRHPVSRVVRPGADRELVDADRPEFLDESARRMELTPRRFGIAMEVTTEVREAFSYRLCHRWYSTVRRLNCERRSSIPIHEHPRSGLASVRSHTG